MTPRKPGDSAAEELLRIDWTDEDPKSTNGVHVLCGGDEVAVVYTEFQPFPGREERVVASLRMTPETFFRALSSMGSVWNRYVLEHGKPDSMPRFRLFGGRELEQLDGAEDV